MIAVICSIVLLLPYDNTQLGSTPILYMKEKAKERPKFYRLW